MRPVTRRRSRGSADAATVAIALHEVRIRTPFATARSWSASTASAYRARVGEIDDVAARARSRSRPARSNAIGTARRYRRSTSFALERPRERDAVLDIDAYVAARARRDDRADPDLREPARDDAAEEARADDDDAPQRSFTARYTHHGQKSAKRTAVAMAASRYRPASVATLSVIPAAHISGGPDPLHGGQAHRKREPDPACGVETVGDDTREHEREGSGRRVVQDQHRLRRHIGDQSAHGEGDGHERRADPTAPPGVEPRSDSAAAIHTAQPSLPRDQMRLHVRGAARQRRRRSVSPARERRP